MTWATRFRIRQYLKGSLWVLPLVSVGLGYGLSFLTSAIDANVELPSWLQYSSSAALTILTTVVGATIGLTGFVVTVSVLCVQMATGTFSARYMRLWYRDGMLKAVLSVLVGTVAFSYALLRRVGTGTVPNFGISLAGLCIGAGLILFLVFLDRFVHRLRPVAVATLVAKGGRASMRAESSAEQVSALPWPQADLDRLAADRAKLTIRATRAGAIQAVDQDGLLRFAVEHDLLLVLRHAVGDFVSHGERMIDAYGTTPDASRAEQRLHGLVALGDERTIDQDPAFALRVMVDVAIRALSAAINDPTTATQVINLLEDILETIGRIPGLQGRLERRDAGGRVRLVIPSRRWEDYLALATTEIRLYGVSSVQVTRRLRAALESLRETVRPEYVAAVDEELARLDATISSRWSGTVDLDRASTPDTQGIGGPPGIAELVGAVESEA